MLSRRNFLLAAPLLASCGSHKRPGFPGYALIANEEGQSLAAVDLATFTVLRHIRLDGRPTQVLAPAGKTSVYALASTQGALYEAGLDDLALKRRLAVGRTAVGMRLSQDETGLFVLCQEPRQLVRVRLADFRVEWRIPLPLEPTDFDMALDHPLAAVCYGNSGAAGFVHLENRRAEAPKPLGKTLSAIRFRKDGKLVMVGSLEGRELVLLDVAHGGVMVRLPLAVRPDNFCMKADGGQLFITGEGMDAVVVVYPFSTEVAETVLAGRAPGAMASLTTEEVDYLFVASPSAADITVLDVEIRRPIAQITVGEEPGSILCTPDGAYALVLNRRSGDMAVIRVAAISSTRRRSAPIFNMIPVGLRPVGGAIRAL